LGWIAGLDFKKPIYHAGYRDEVIQLSRKTMFLEFSYVEKRERGQGSWGYPLYP
jgi:hypothetical protein